MRKIYIKNSIFFLLLIAFQSARAQRPFGNEWINFSQTYYKVKVAKDGIYRLDQNALSAAGVNVGSLNPKQVQLFYRGEQVPVYIAGEGDGTFDAGDYIEFWGQRNDGALDALLFSNKNDITHTDYSSYTDTSVYFLTMSASGPFARIQQSNTISGSGAIETVIGTQAKYFHYNYLDGNPVVDGPDPRYIPEYSKGEGWMSIAYNAPNNPLFKADTFVIQDAKAGSSFIPKLDFKVVSQNMNPNANPDHRLQVDIQSASSGKHTLLDTSYEGYTVVQRSLPVSLTDLDGTTYVTITPVNINGRSHAAVAYEKITYEKELNAFVQQGIPFEYGPVSGGGTITFGFYLPSGFGTPDMLLYDVTNGARAVSFYDNGKVYFTLPAPGAASRYVLVKPDEYTAPQVSTVMLKNINLNAGYNFLLVTHPTLLNAATQYALYKDQQIISKKDNFKTLVVTTQELYDVFSYGQKHPIAIQNFSAWMYKKASVKPQFLFLVGKGVSINATRNKSLLATSHDLVPVIGMPATDLLYIAGIPNGFSGQDTLHPVMGVGRLPAKDEQEVLTYLEKLKQYDASPSALWHKDAVHVGGGTDIFVQENARRILKNGENIYINKNVGGHVNTYLAKSADPVFKDLRAAIQNNIQQGVGLLTYYGHAAGTLLGVEIADFTTLSNKGKYPVMYLNGCSVGDFSIYESTTMAEDYLLRADKGGISWISHSTTALSNTLEDQMMGFYRNMSKDSTYGTSVGNVWAKTIADLHVPVSYTNQDRMAAFAWTFQGDPSVRFHHDQLPDYSIKEKEIYLSPNDVVATMDVFYVKIPISNLGRATDRLLGITVKQITPSGQNIDYGPEFLTKGIYYKDTVEIAIHPGGRSIQGMNRFIIEINGDKSIEESDYTNNRVDVSFLIKGNGARALTPANYAISGTDTITLVSQSRNLFDTTTAAYFELDTTITFSSAYKKSSPLIKGGNILSWKVQLLKEDSVVYYWRTRLDLPADSGGGWDTRSFTYLKGKGPGWSQSRAPHYSGINYESISFDSSLQQFAYGKLYSKLKAAAFIYNLKAGIGIYREGENQTNCWGIGTIAVMEIDRKTLESVNDTIYTSNRPSPGCLGAHLRYMYFDMQDAAQRQFFVNVVDRMKDGNYIAVATRYEHQNFKDWEPNVIAAFKKLGSSAIEDVVKYNDSVAYVLVGIKQSVQGKTVGEKYVYDPVTTPMPGDTAIVETPIEGIGDPNGIITSERIGPSSKWKEMFNHFNSLENPSTDNVMMQVLGVNDSTGEDEVIMTNITASNVDLSAIDANKYKFIRLQAIISDSTSLTPAQLKDWTVLYDAVPEGTLAVDKEFKFNNDTMEQGRNLYVKIKYRNISQYPMKNVLVRTAILNSNGQVVGTAKDKRYKALQPGEFFYVEDTLPVTIQMTGENQLSVYVNPDFEQPELSLENNYVNLLFYVPTGRFNPLMDVTFDGRHLRYGDIVSTKPKIVVDAWTDRGVMPLYDTTFFSLTLAGPDNDSARRINFSSTDVVFQEGTFDNPHASVIFTPALAPGEYTFTAQVRDVKGQTAGPLPYNVKFKVVGERKASRVYVYPNPVRGSAKFVFTLTGEEVPDLISIQIFDLRGQAVNEINLAGGDRFIGHNEVEWNGTAANGNLLPSGVYLYRVILKKNEKEIPIYSVPEDRDLEKTYGKILILRE